MLVLYMTAAHGAMGWNSCDDENLHGLVISQGGTGWLDSAFLERIYIQEGA